MKNLIVFLLFSALSFSFVDLGTHGATYKIIEEDFYEMVKKAVKNVNPEEWKKEIIKQIKAQATAKTNLPYGKKFSKRVEKNEYPLEMDIRNPAGRIIKKKGEKILIRNDVPIDICFIDGLNHAFLVNQIRYFDALVKKMSGPHAECTYLVSNYDVLKLGKEFYPKDFYPTSPAFEKKFAIKSIPSYVHFEGENRTIYSFPISMFKHEVKLNEKSK